MKSSSMHRKRIRQRHPPPFGATWRIVALFLGGTLVRILTLRSSSSMPSARQTSLTLDIPSRSDDLHIWLQSSNAQLHLPDANVAATRILEQSCLPYENDLPHALDPAMCPIHENDGIDRIGILRPPGLLGSVFEDYIVQFLEQRRDDDGNDEEDVIIVQAHPWNGASPAFTKVLRPVVLPIVLEAIDVALQTVDDEASSASDHSITADEMLGVTRLLLRWHCRVAQIATHTPLLSISFHQLMTHPQDVDRALTEFFEFTNHHDDDRSMDGYAETVLARIDAATSVWNAVRSRTTLDALRAAVSEELSVCLAGGDAAIPLASSRVVDLVGSVLDGTSAATACQRYPQAKLCTAKQKGNEG